MEGVETEGDRSENTCERFRVGFKVFRSSRHATFSGCPQESSFSLKFSNPSIPSSSAAVSTAMGETIRHRPSLVGSNS